MLSYAKRLAWTSQWSANGRPPCPQEDQMRASRLFQMQLKETDISDRRQDDHAGQTELLEEEIATMQKPTRLTIFARPQFGVQERQQMEDLLDMDLNPDLT